MRLLGVNRIDSTTLAAGSPVPGPRILPRRPVGANYGSPAQPEGLVEDLAAPDAISCLEQLDELGRPFQGEVLGELLPSAGIMKKRLIDVPDLMQEQMEQIVRANLLRGPLERGTALLIKPARAPAAVVPPCGLGRRIRPDHLIGSGEGIQDDAAEPPARLDP